MLSLSQSTMEVVEVVRKTDALLGYINLREEQSKVLVPLSKRETYNFVSLLVLSACF